MFSFFRQKKQNEVRDCVQRILNRSAPNPSEFEDLRLDPRYDRSVPVILIPWDREPLVEHACYALVQNLSDFGARLIAQKPILVEELLCCFAVDDVQFLLATVQRSKPLGGGFWECGIRFSESITPAAHLRLDDLQPFVEGLSTESDRPAPALCSPLETR
jgi:hypothetical protein